MNLLRLLWTPFALTGRAFGRYWLGTGRHDGDAGGWDVAPAGPRSAEAAGSAPLLEVLSAVVAVSLLAAVMVGAALNA